MSSADPRRPASRSSSAALLRLAGARRAFTGSPPIRALDGVDLSFEAGEYVAVTGRSGSGKSTLLNVLGLLEGLTAGDYVVGGTSTSALRGREADRLRAEVFGFVFQSFHLVPHLTAAENVELGLTYRPARREQRRRLTADVLDRVGLVPRAHSPVGVLSGGERQRVAIARALVRSPAVLLADEPTGNLDEVTAAEILDAFDAIHRSGVTVVVVTHDPVTAGRASRRVVLRDGRVSTDSAAEASHASA